MSVKIRRILLIIVALAALTFFITPVVFSISSVGPMVAMPLILTRNGEPIPRMEIELLQYAFREAPTSFDRISLEQLKDAKAFQIGFLVDAPSTTTRTWIFGRPSTSPEYRSLTIRLSLINGEAFTMSIPVLSDTALNLPIQIDITTKKK